MTCSETKRLADEDWPLYRITDSGLCCYEVTDSKVEVAKVVADVETKPDYVRRSQFYELPNNKTRVYLYFRQS